MRTGKYLMMLGALACLAMASGDLRAEPATTAVSSQDTAVATEIEHRLSDDRAINAQQVVIDVRDGVVTLRGRVPNEDAKDRAEALANKVAGVDEVRNHLSAGNSAAEIDREPGPIPEEMPAGR